MAKVKLERDRFAKFTFNDKENLEWITTSVEAYFNARTDDEIRKKVENNGDCLDVPIIGSEGELHFKVAAFYKGTWILSFYSSSKAILDGVSYILNQNTHKDIYQWAEDSKVGEFTYYYSNIVFHKKDGVYAADRDYILNGRYI